MHTPELSADFDASVAIYAGERGLARPWGSGNDELIPALAEHGIDTLYAERSTEVEADEDAPASIMAYRPVAVSRGDIRLAETAERMSLSEHGIGITAVRSRIVTPPWMERAVPTINGSALRRFGNSHWRQYEAFGDVMAHTVYAGPGEVFDEDTLDEFAGGHVVVKSDGGMAGKYNSIVRKPDVPTALQDLRERRAANGRKDQGFVLQAYEPGEPVTGLRAARAEQQSMLDELGVNDNAELRTYVFADNLQGLRLRPWSVYRLQPGSTDEAIIQIDQDTVPSEHHELIQGITSHTMAETGVSGACMAIDTYGGRGDRLREINTQDPSLVEVLDDSDPVLLDEMRIKQIREGLAPLMVVLAKGNRI